MSISFSRLSSFDEEASLGQHTHRMHKLYVEPEPQKQGPAAQPKSKTQTTEVECAAVVQQSKEAETTKVPKQEKELKPLDPKDPGVLRF